MTRFRHAVGLPVVLSAALFLVAPVFAEVTLPRILDNNMVLQRDIPLPVWGWAEPGEEVTVSIADQKCSAKTDSQGRWQLKLAPLAASSKPFEMTIVGKNTITLENILVGEVWVCSGQSNMGMSVSQVQDAEKELAGADQPMIRLFESPKSPSPRPTSDVFGRWQACTPETVKGFTAAGYFFGRNLQARLNVPIGLINTSWGGTRIEPWTPAQAFAEVPALKDIAEQVAQQTGEQTKALAPLIPSVEAWARAARAAQAKGESIPPLPALPGSRLGEHSKPTTLYNGMVAGLVPYAIRGAIWYQGESNVTEGMLYFEKMKALIAGWRQVWGQGDFPFYYVQLAPYRYGNQPQNLPGLWEAQVAALSIPNTGMAVTNDIGALGDIHPKNKQDVGKRLALWALAKTYGQKDVVYSGPLYKSMKIEGDKIRISFDHAGGGLVSRDGEPLSWFEIAGPDGKFAKADAKIDGDTVVVSSEEVTQPAGVRFAWSQVAQPNLMNRNGLPASAFRTDGPLTDRTAAVANQP
jgi:sialate O-acetylesterase